MYSSAEPSTSGSSSIWYRDDRRFTAHDVLPLCRAHDWSAARKPRELLVAIKNSHAIVTAWDGPRLVGRANAVSDGSLVVYYPQALVLREYQRRGIGYEMMQRPMSRYSGFHPQVLLADSEAIGFYRRCGFHRAGQTEPMWIYAGCEH